MGESWKCALSDPLSYWAQYSTDSRNCARVRRNYVPVPSLMRDEWPCSGQIALCIS